MLDLLFVYLNTVKYKDVFDELNAGSNSVFYLEQLKMGNKRALGTPL